MRKALLAIFVIILGVSIYCYLLSNPLPSPQVLNELLLTPNGWTLELYLPSDDNTSGWYITSNIDTAYLRSMEMSRNTLYIITKDSLIDPFNFNKTAGDKLTLHRSGGMEMGQLEFGATTNADIAMPKAGQSISWDGYAFYLDNTPTLGYWNDTLNANGCVVGTVKTDGDVPLQNVQVMGYPATTTDSSGFFMLTNIAWRENIIFSKQGYMVQDTLVQIWPESTITVNVKMSSIVSVKRTETQIIPKDFSISEPFPNPFNPETQIQYTLPKNGNVEIEVFDIGGRLVDKIFSGYQSKGSYQARWNAIHLSSGIYVIRIQTGESVLSRKCLLTK